MHPILLQIGDHLILTHNAFMALGLAFGAVVFYKESRRHQQTSEGMLWIIAGALICGAIGAKVSTILGNFGEGALPWRGVILHGGRSILGGLTGGYIGVELTKRALGYRRGTGDLFAPATALGCAVGKLGCHFSELPGTPTTLPWGIRLDPIAVMRTPGCPAYCATSALHPSMLYESIFQLTMFLLLWTKLRFVSALEGELMKLYLLMYAVFRFLVEFVRGNDVAWHGLSRHQLFLIPVILLLAGYFIRWTARQSRARTIAPEVA